jgi:LPXTG-motif cell wall-anchored protein
MKKLRLIAAVAIAGAFMMLSTGAAQAYPDTNGVTLTTNSPLVGGKVVKFVAQADFECSTWTITFSDGKASSETSTRTDTSGTDTFTGSYVSKVVDKKTTTHMTASCTYDNGCPTTGPSKPECQVVAPAEKKPDAVIPAFYSIGSGSSAIQALTRHASATAKVVLLPESSDDNGILPNTGGLRLSLLVLGGLLVVGGAGVTYAARRRNATH